MTNSSRLFLATLASGAVVLFGLIGLAMKSITPVYEGFLQLCGVAAETCRAILTSVNPASLVAAGAIAYLGVIFFWQLALTLTTVRRVSARSLPRPAYLEAMLMRLGLSGKVRVVAGHHLFCEGLLSPKIVIGREVLRSLSNRELEAALRHESAHVRSFDPLRMLLTASLARGFFFVPVVAELSRRYSLEKEISADRYAEASVGRTYLARALYKVLSRRSPSPELLPAFLPNFASDRSRLGALQSGIYFGSFSSTGLAISVIMLTLIFSNLFQHAATLGGCQ